MSEHAEPSLGTNSNDLNDTRAVYFPASIRDPHINTVRYARLPPDDKIKRKGLKTAN